jgi:hypothetical protein
MYGSGIIMIEGFKNYSGEGHAARGFDYRIGKLYTIESRLGREHITMVGMFSTEGKTL